MIICQWNLLYALQLQKQAYDKEVKPSSYTLSNMIWLNNKYIKTKWNKKLEDKSFEPFQILHSVRKKAYKLELPKK